MVLVLVLCACLVTGCAHVRWQPPAQPDPSAILTEAEEDARSGRHADALDKFVWFHHNALRYERALMGVRLSFALASWHELGQKYPPAMHELKAIRDEAHRKMVAGVGQWNDFHDLAAINDVLDDMGATATLFVWLDQHDPVLARRVYRVAELALIEQKLYQLCNKYIEMPGHLHDLLRSHRSNLRLGSEPEMLQYAQESLRYHASLLVALLTVNQRLSEADQVMREVLQADPDETLRLRLEEARKGHVPKAWPRLRG